jgi:membrane associated rhomboid family serine protease
MTEPPTVPGSGQAPAEAVPTCYRHPGRETYVRCQRCSRPICPECQIPAAVGVQCPDDVREGNRSVRQARTTFGGVIRSGSATVTISLLVITTVVSVLDFVGLRAIGDELAMVPGLPDQIGILNGEYYRLLTAAFVHGNFIHLLVNMYSLWVLGTHLEPLLGRIRFLGLYILGALGGSAASYALNYPIVDDRFLFSSVGASGAIFALFGAMVPVMRRLNYDLRPLFVVLGINVFIGFTLPLIDWRAHLGGFLVGLFIGAGLAYAPRERRGLFQAAVFAVAFVAIVMVVVVRTAQLTG